MIDQLVIGPMRSMFVAPTELTSPSSKHPAWLRAWLEELEEDPTPRTLCTYSPTMIHFVEQAWRSNCPYYDRIWLRADSETTDVALLDTGHEASWFAHFSLADLYMCGEFDKFLGGAKGV